MCWELWIDDERFPEYIGIDYPVVVARNSYDAIRFVESWGVPKTIYFDHDLGGQDTAMVFVKWLSNQLMDEKLSLPLDFSFDIHSMNPVGADNIRSYMTQIVHNFKEK